MTYVAMEQQSLPWLHGVLMDLPDLLPEDSSDDAWFDWDDESGNVHQKRNLLQLAALMQAVKCVQSLLEKGMDACVASPSYGKTALHLVCACRPSMASAKVIALLVQHGADREALDHDGKAPGFALENMTSKKEETGHNSVCKMHTCTGKHHAGDIKIKVEHSSDKISDSSKLLTPVSVLEEIDGCDYNGVHFRMFHYKVDACPHTDCLHDTSSCPYVHPGEKSKRRNPGVYMYQPVPCPHFRKGNCKKGDACPLSHGVFECWLHPSKYRTQLCTEGSGCTRNLCFFAHSLQELREVSDSCEPCEIEACIAMSPSSGTSSPSEKSYSLFDVHPSAADDTDLLYGGKIAALQANAVERERVRRDAAVADAVIALKAFAASRKTTIPLLDHVGTLAPKAESCNADECSVLSIPASDSCKSLVGSEHAYEHW